MSIIGDPRGLPWGALPPALEQAIGLIHLARVRCMPTQPPHMGSQGLLLYIQI